MSWVALANRPAPTVLDAGRMPAVRWSDGWERKRPAGCQRSNREDGGAFADASYAALFAAVQDEGDGGGAGFVVCGAVVVVCVGV